MKLYGKDRLKARLDAVAANNRIPHAIMFSGNAGCGRKILARYTAQLFLCGDHACGECAVCRNIENDSHPDVIFVKRECGGKYAIDDLRPILRDTVVRPNNGDIKIYIFEDLDTSLPKIQNALLKLIEEPPAHLRFIFTCENTDVVLETVMSRVMEFEVPDTSVGDCARCLVDGGADPQKAKELSEMFAGNIAKCRAILDSSDGSDREQKLIETARRAAAAIGKRDGFGTAAALSEFSGNSTREEFSAVFEYLSRILRDALALKYGGTAEFFGKAESRKIAGQFSEAEILNMLDAAFEVEKNSGRNPNLALTAVYFTSKILQNR